ncbi:hypothetical protein RRG08_047061 [Elysia crispata]|uniref:Uncharacterized protein n=1 Tax=Elysia crispata TaxID=231223 RepID=A0AAE1E5N0_9GAST|nr:hypothetical protein RRG08_047061 [Elysia crispata]
MASASPVTGREDHTASPISTINIDELSHLKSITEDDVYQQLRRHFIRYGKGRPCDLPKVDGVTNGLLLKLYVIKEECNASFRELKDWLTKLVPNTESVSESRVYQRILQIIKVCVDGDSRPAPFLQESHCFHSLSDSLSAHGLKRCHISGAAPYTLPPSSDIINKVVVDLEKIRAQEREGQSFVHKWVKRQSSSCSGLTMIQVKRKVDKC